MRGTVLALLLLAAGSASAASIDATDDGTGGKNARYVPFDLAVSPGEQMTLRDTGQDPHTMTSVDGAWSAISVEPGKSAGFPAPAKEGDYKFYCAYHASPATQPGQGMAGVLHVKTAGTGGSAPTGPTQRTPDVGPLGLLACLALALFRRPA